jgi:hypothetical protein
LINSRNRRCWCSIFFIRRFNRQFKQHIFVHSKSTKLKRINNRMSYS